MRSKGAKTAWLMLAPLLTGVVVFFAVPFVILVRYSFIFGERYVGLENYRNVISSATFRLAFWNTCKFVFIGVILNLILSFTLAALLKRRFPGARLIRSAYILPMFLPVAAIVTVVALFFGEGGLANWILNSLGILPVDWIRSGFAFPLVLGLYVFKSFGYSVVLILAGMQMIPQSYYEVASIEGAGVLWKVFHITIPLLTPTLFFAFLIAMLNCFRSFRDVFILGGNHPHESIYMLPHFINNNIQNLNYPRLAVASVITLAAISLVILVVYRFEKSTEEWL